MGHPQSSAIRTLWRVGRRTFSQPSSASRPIPPHAPIPANKLIRSVKRSGIAAHLPQSRMSRSTTHLYVLSEFANIGSPVEINCLHGRHIRPRRISRFIDDISQLNFLKEIKGSSHALSSPVRCYACSRDRDLIRRPAPPTHPPTHTHTRTYGRGGFAPDRSFREHRFLQ